MSDIASYLGISLTIILFIIGVFLFRNPAFLKLAFRNIFQRKTLLLSIITLITLITSIVASAIFINDSYGKYYQNQVTSKIGDTDAIIYNRNQDTIWDRQESGKVYANVLNEFNSFLPIYFEASTISKESQIETQNIVVISFDPSTATSYSEAQDESKRYEVDGNEAIISKSLATKYSLNEGDILKLDFHNNSSEIKIKSIMDDNGLIGFNFPVSSRQNNYEGSIFISQSLLQNHLKSSRTENFNSILLKTSADYSQDSTILGRINERLASYDRDIVFEEIRQSFIAIITGGNGLNLSQIILIGGLIPLLTLLFLYTLLVNELTDANKKPLSILKILGIKPYNIILLNFVEGIFYIGLGVIMGTLVGSGIATVFIKYLPLFLNTSSTSSEINIIINAESTLVAAGLSFICLSLLSLLIYTRIINIYKFFDLAKSRFNASKYAKFKVKNSTYLMLLALASLAGFYYLFWGYVKDADQKNLLLFFNAQILAWIVAYYLKAIFPNIRHLVINIICLITIGLNFFGYRLDIIKSNWEKEPLIFVINTLILIFFASLFVINNLVLFKTILKKLRFSSSKITFAWGLINSSVNFLWLCMFLALLIYVIILFPEGQSIINRAKVDLKSRYDVLITDSLGLADSNKLKEDLTGTAEINRIQDIDYGTIEFPDFSYEKIGIGDKAASVGQTAADGFRESISTFDATDISSINIKTDIDQNEAKANFLTSNQFIILGENYDIGFSESNLRPDIRIGDKVKVEFSGNFIVERTVIGILEQTNEDDSNLDQNEQSEVLISRNGIFLSNADYLALRQNNKIYLSTIYGLSYKENANRNEVESNIKQIVKDYPVSVIYNPGSEFSGSLNLVEKLIGLVSYLAYMGLVILTLAIGYIFIVNFVKESKLMNVLEKNGFSRRFIAQSYVTCVLSLYIIAFLVGVGANYWSTKLLFDYALKDQSLTFDFIYKPEFLYTPALLLLISIIISTIFIYIRIMKFDYKNEK